MLSLYSSFATSGSKSYHNIIKIVVVCLLLFGGLTAFVDKKADFKGEWNFNESKSKLGEGRFRMAAQKLKVSEEGELLVIERTSNAPDGQTFSKSEKLNFDGIATETTVFGSAKKTSLATWSENGEELMIRSTITGERNGNTFEFKVTEVWKLGHGGKSLSIDYTSESQRGTNNQTFVYDRK